LTREQSEPPRSLIADRKALTRHDFDTYIHLVGGENSKSAKLAA